MVIDHDANFDDAVARCVFGGYYQSGQSCISVQRILVHRKVYDAFRDKFVAAVRNIKTGDPRDEQTVVGPIITEDDAKRIETTIKHAVEQGGKLLCGGKRNGRIVEPAVLENVPHNAEASCEEIFGPVTLLEAFDDFDEALATVNDSHYGLQAGVFTRDIVKIQKAWDELEVGGVMINEIPVVACRPNALRRQQRQRPRPRRHPLGDREHDRGAAARDSHAARLIQTMTWEGEAPAEPRRKRLGRSLAIPSPAR